MSSTLFVLFVLVAVATGSEGWKRSPPNILVIIGDDVGVNDVGWQGNSDMPTPVMNQLASDGVILTNQHVQVLCTATRAAFLTGRFPIRYGRQHWVARPAYKVGLDLEEELLPEKLQKEGYKTHLVGKWHLGFNKIDYLPTSRGFDTFYGTYQGQCDHIEHVRAWNTTQGRAIDCIFPNDMDQEVFCQDNMRKMVKECSDGPSEACSAIEKIMIDHNCFDLPENHDPDEILFIPPTADETFFQKNKSHQNKSPNSDEPNEVFEGWCMHRDTPGNYQASYERRGVFSSQAFGEEAVEIITNHDTKKPMYMQLAFTAAHTPIQEDPNKKQFCMDSEGNQKYPFVLRDLLCTMMKGMDDAIGSVVQALKDKGMYENTVIVFFSDNGGLPFQSSNFPHRGTKSTIWEGGLRVPAWVHAPGRIFRKGHRDGLAHAVDWFTTLLALARGKEDDFEPFNNVTETSAARNDVIDGKNIWPHIAYGFPSSRYEVLLNIDDDVNCIGQVGFLPVGNNAAYIFGDYKLIQGDPGNVIQNCNIGDGFSQPRPISSYNCPISPNEAGFSLYNIKQDPGESENLIDDKRYWWLVKLMRLRLFWYRKALVPLNNENYPLDFDPASDPALNGGVWTFWNE